MALPAEQIPRPSLSLAGRSAGDPAGLPSQSLPEQPQRIEQPEQANQPHRIEQPEQADQPHRVEQPEQAGRAAGSLPGLPPLSFPEQPAGQGPAPAAGGYSPRSPGDQEPGQAPSRPPPRPPRPARPTRPPEREVQQRAFAALIFGLLSLLALLGVGYNLHRGIYLVIFALVVGPLACWLAISAMRRAHRDGTWRPRGAIAGVIFGVLATVLGLGMLALFTLAARQVSQYSQCLSQAQTTSAQQACTSQFERSFNAGFGPAGGG
jgi:hypothetical protein